tara:strand:- start:1160 stop:1957 length:798 start_codon:yes stop_codon:yes gene_type:complete
MSIIVYTPEFFNNIKNEVKDSEINETLKKDIKNLITSYSCFKRYRNFNNNYKKKTYYKSYTPKTDDKIIIGYLNKITNNNYDILLKKIIINTTDINFKLIIDKLNFISFKQSNYSELYINLYKSIITDENRNNYLNEKINDIILNKNNELKLIVNNTSSTSYNEFCDINKEKKNLKGKIKIILNLIKNNIIDFDNNYIYENILKYKDYDNDIYLEILQIINNIIGLDNKNINDLNNYLETNNFNGKMMFKFKIKDIIENKQIKEF